MVSIQVGESSDVSILVDDKVNVIAYVSPLENSNVHSVCCSKEYTEFLKILLVHLPIVDKSG